MKNSLTYQKTKDKNLENQTLDKKSLKLRKRIGDENRGLE